MKNNSKPITKGLRITLIVISCLLCFASPSVSRAQQVTLPRQTLTVKQAINAIEKQTGKKFVYNSDIDVNRRVNVNARKGDLRKVLNDLLSSYNVTYEFVGDNIVLTKKTVRPHVTSQPAKTKKIVHGQVTDMNGEPIVGATVREVDNPQTGVVTDIDGNFSLPMNGNTNITVSYVGFDSQTLRPSGQGVMKIRMKETHNDLNEVVVVGYGTMKKRDLTGAVSSVKMDDEPVGTVSTISHALAGKAAGLQVVANSAQPGGAATFRIRGAASVNGGNDPLIIIDGFPVSSYNDISMGRYNSGTSDNLLGSINPNDIESIEVLKDASATAIYGARAGHGVIIVTTKKGKKSRAKVNYSGSVSLQCIAKNYEMLDAKEFMQATNSYWHEKWLKDNGLGIYGQRSESDAPAYTPTYSESEINNPVYDTDWIGEVTRSGMQTSHNVSVTGGTDATRYMMSGNYLHQDGIVKNNDMDHFTARMNVDQDINKMVKVGVNLTLSKITTDNVPLGTGQNEYAGILVSASQFSPVLPVRGENGEYTLNSLAAFVPNPVSLLEITDKSTKERTLGTVYIEFRPMKDLLLRGNFGLDRNSQRRETYLPKTTLYGYKKNGQAEIGQFDKTDYLLELTATYNKEFGKHSISGMAGYSFQRFTSKWVTAGNSDFITDGFKYNNLAAGAYPSPTVGSSASKTEMASFFGRINYTYDDRYLMTATLRADGASNFAENHRWGYFPSIALGWRFSEENFMKRFKWLSNGKLRLSYGQTGNSNVGNKAVSYYATGYNSEFGSTKHVGVYLAQQGNPDLKWETTTEWNLGLDLGFLNNRISLTAEVFHRIVSDLLNTQNLMSYYEVSSIMGNVGKTQSNGFELTINTSNISTHNFDWNTTFTFSLYRDKWKERSPEWKPAAYDEYNSPIRYYYGYKSDGLIQPGEDVSYQKGAIPGQVKLLDIDGYVYNEDGSYQVDKHGIPLKTGKPDGKLDDADKVIYGSADPDFNVGLNNSLRYKNFDLNIYFYGQFGLYTQGSYKELWLTGANGYTGVAKLPLGYNMPVSVKDIWRSNNTSGSQPSYFQTDSSYGIGDYYLRKIWYLRCRNITIGYTLPIKSKAISKLRFYADVNNPFCLTPYNGLDPETDSSVWAYPNVRSFTFGLDVTF